MANLFSINSLANPLTVAKQYAKILVALPNNAGVRNGKFRNGGHYSRSWLDTNTTQTPKTGTYLRLRFPATRDESGRALYCSTQQNREHDTRADHFQTPGNEIIVLSVAGSTPNVFEALSVDPCIRYLIAYCTLPYGNGQGKG